MDAETGERSETYDLEMQSESIGLGSKVAVVKEEDPYSGTLGRVMGISVSSSGEIMCQVDFGDSNTRSFREKELILMRSLHGGFVTGLVSLWSKPEKNPMHCQQWNGHALISVTDSVQGVAAFGCALNTIVNTRESVGTRLFDMNDFDHPYQPAWDAIHRWFLHPIRIIL